MNSPESEHALETFTVELNRLELAGALGAVRAVYDAAPGEPPRPLVTAAYKLDQALQASDTP